MTKASSGRAFLWLGLLIPLAAIATYAVQVTQARLTTPWYLPPLLTLGAVLSLLSLRARRSFARIAATIAIGLLAIGGWLFINAVRLPKYEGPVAIGQPFPAFTTLQADGKPFTESNLKGDLHHVFVFFRGRW